MIKQIVLATALTAFSISMAFAQDLRMTVWTGSDAHLGMLNDIADEFESTHPGVTVNFETIPFSDYVRGLTLQLAGGNPPDLGWLLKAGIDCALEMQWKGCDNPAIDTTNTGGKA